MASKVSLSDIVRDVFKSFEGRHDLKIEFDLDESLPKLYGEHDQACESPNQVMHRLYWESMTHGRGDRKVVTLLEGDQQICHIYHSGEHIPERKLGFWNETLRMLYSGEKELESTGRFRHGGNNTVAHDLHAMGGTIKYENVDECGYKVKCTVTLPNHKPLNTSFPSLNTC